MSSERIQAQAPPFTVKSSKNLLLSGWAFLTIALYGLLALLNQLPDPLIPFLLALSWGLLLLPLFVHRPLDWFAPPIFLLWSGSKSFFRPITWLTQGEIDVNLPTTLDENLSLLRWVLLAHIGASATYLLTFYGHRQAEWARRASRHLDLRQLDNWQSSRLMFLFSLAFPIAVASYFFILYAAGIDSIWEMLLRWRSKQELLAGKFYPLTIINLFALIILMLLVHGWQKRLPYFKNFGLLCLIVYSAAIVMFGLRGHIVRIWIMALGLYHYLVRRISLGALLLTLMIIFLFAFISFQVRYAAFKGDISEGKLPTITITTESVLQLIEMDLSTRGLDNQLIAFYVFPKYIPFQWGRSWLALVTLPIPRAIWQDKPVLTPGGLVRDQFYGGGGSLPLGYMGDFYANFSVFGIILGYWILGLYHRVLYEWHRLHWDNFSVNFLYVVLLVNFTTLEPLSFIHAAMYCLPAILLVKFVGKKR